VPGARRIILDGRVPIRRVRRSRESRPSNQRHGIVDIQALMMAFMVAIASRGGPDETANTRALSIGAETSAAVSGDGDLTWRFPRLGKIFLHGKSSPDSVAAASRRQRGNGRGTRPDIYMIARARVRAFATIYRVLIIFVHPPSPLRFDVGATPRAISARANSFNNSELNAFRAMPRMRARACVRASSTNPSRIRPFREMMSLCRGYLLIIILISDTNPLYILFGTFIRERQKEKERERGREKRGKKQLTDDVGTFICLLQWRAGGSESLIIVTIW